MLTTPEAALIPVSVVVGLGPSAGRLITFEIGGDRQASFNLSSRSRIHGDDVSLAITHRKADANSLTFKLVNDGKPVVDMRMTETVVRSLSGRLNAHARNDSGTPAEPIWLVECRADPPEGLAVMSPATRRHRDRHLSSAGAHASLLSTLCGKSHLPPGMIATVATAVPRYLPRHVNGV